MIPLVPRRPAAPNRWVVISRPQPQAHIRLFCFPYAGGTAAEYHGWPAMLPATIEVCAVQLPGRANRLAETPFASVPTLVPALEDALAPLLDKPFAFFGHSMGALLAFELARHLRRTRALEPSHLFVSAARAPAIASREPALHDLTDAEFARALRHVEGTPAEVLDDPDLMALVVPAVRADFAVCETYRYRKGPKLTCPVSALGGTYDRRVLRADLEGWAAETHGAFTIQTVPGGHHFLHEQRERLLRCIREALASDARHRRPGR